MFLQKAITHKETLVQQQQPECPSFIGAAAHLSQGTVHFDQQWNVSGCWLSYHQHRWWLH